mgnify:CR=1 FL=1
MLPKPCWNSSINRIIPQSKSQKTLQTHSLNWNTPIQTVNPQIQEFKDIVIWYAQWDLPYAQKPLHITLCTINPFGGSFELRFTIKIVKLLITVQSNTLYSDYGGFYRQQIIINYHKRGEMYWEFKNLTQHIENAMESLNKTCN